LTRMFAQDKPSHL